MLAIYTDGMRWWGALAGYAILANMMRGYAPPPDAERDKWTKLAFALFLVIAGTLIPLSFRVPWLAQGTVRWNVIVAIFWTCASAAGWLGLSGRAQRPWAMRSSGSLLLGGAMFAAALTHL